MIQLPKESGRLVIGKWIRAPERGERARAGREAASLSGPRSLIFRVRGHLEQQHPVRFEAGALRGGVRCVGGLVMPP
jgi:hypothetical protein